MVASQVYKTALANRLAGIDRESHLVAQRSDNKEREFGKFRETKTEMLTSNYGKSSSPGKKSQSPMKSPGKKGGNGSVVFNPAGCWTKAEFETYMKTITIDEEDIFEEKTTIFTCYKSALKQAWLFAQECEKLNLPKWNDTTFGPNTQDPHGHWSIYVQEDPLPGYPVTDEIEWFRPEEITEQPLDAKFMAGGADANDVIQGQIGDCWLISAFSTLATDDTYIVGDFDPTVSKEVDNENAPGMMNGVYPPMFHFLNDKGIYVIRFFKNYKWTYVIIDDR